MKAPLLALATATIASIGGTRLSSIAIPWLVLTTTNDPVLAGLAGFAEMLPYVLAKALSGPLIDRLGARRIALTCDGLSAVAVALVPLLYWAGLLSIWVLLPAVAVIGILRAPSDAAKQALVPHVATLGHVALERVTGIMGASDRLAGTLGAAGAGALIALLGAAPALLGNALAFCLSALVLGFGVPAQPRNEPSGDDPATGSYTRDLATGWHALRQEPVLISLTIMIAITNLFDQAYGSILLPVWVRTNALDASWVGTFLAVFSGAAIAGAALAAAYAEKLPRLAIYILGFFCAGPLPMAGFALNLSPPMLIALLLIAGFTAGFLNPIIGALLFERIPKPVVGRVIALFGALTWCLIPFGGLYAGMLINAVGITTSFALTAALYLIAALAPIIVPSFRQMNRRPQPS